MSFWSVFTSVSFPIPRCLLRLCSLQHLLSPRQTKLMSPDPQFCTLTINLSHFSTSFHPHLLCCFVIFLPFQDQSLTSPGFHCWCSSRSNVVTIQREWWPGRYGKPIRPGDQNLRKQAQERSELPQVLSDRQAEDQNVGSGTRHGKLEITSGLYCCFNVMETFLF